MFTYVCFVTCVICSVQVVCKILCQPDFLTYKLFTILWSKINHLPYITLNVVTEWLSIFALYLRGSRFKSGLRDWLS
jgi:hypothetical protein